MPALPPLVDRDAVVRDRNEIRGADAVRRRERVRGVGDGGPSGSRGGDALVVHADDADRAVGARADRDLARVQLHDVGVVRSPDLEAAFEQRDRRAVFLHGDVELRSLDDGHEQRRLDAELADLAGRYVVEDVAAMLHQPCDEVAVDGLGRNLDVGVVRHADVRAGLRETEHAVVACDDARRQHNGGVRRYGNRVARHVHVDVAADGGYGDARIVDATRHGRCRLGGRSSDYEKQGRRELEKTRRKRTRVCSFLHAHVGHSVSSTSDRIEIGRRACCDGPHGKVE